MRSASPLKQSVQIFPSRRRVQGNLPPICISRHQLDVVGATSLAAWRDFSTDATRCPSCRRTCMASEDQPLVLPPPSTSSPLTPPSYFYSPPPPRNLMFYFGSQKEA